MKKCALVHFCCVSISDFTTFVNHVRIKRKLEFVEGKEKSMSAEIWSGIYPNMKNKDTVNLGKGNKAMDAWNMHLSEIRNCPENLSTELLWQVLCELEQTYFCTVKGIPFTYIIKGHEMFVNRKEKSITQATILLSARRVLEKQAEGVVVSGPKKIGTFGASYLYPVFCQIGLITEKMNESEVM